MWRKGGSEKDAIGCFMGDEESSRGFWQLDSY